VPPSLAAAGRRVSSHELLPRPDCRRPGCPLSASSSETLRVAPGSLLVPRSPSPGARVLLPPPPQARRAALRGFGAGRSATRRRRAGSVSGSSLRHGERTEHGARLARLAQLGDRNLRAPSSKQMCPRLAASRKASRLRPLPSPFPPPPLAAAAAASSPPPHPALCSAGSTAQWRARLRPRHVAV
jgi:hypothetical protein